MSILGKLIKTTVDIALLPVSAVGDVLNAPAILDGKESITSQNLKAIGKDVIKIYDEIERL